MKKLFAGILCAALLITAVGCGKQATLPLGDGGTPPVQQEKADGVTPISVLTGRYFDYEYDDELGLLATMCYPVVSLGEAENYPALKKALEDVSRDKRVRITDEFSMIREYAKEDVALDGDYFSPYKLEETVSVRRADTTAVSLLFSTEQYSGGVHGYERYWGETYDTKTGKALSLTDAVTDIHAFSGLVTEALTERLEDSLSYFEDVDVEEILSGEGASWTLDHTGVTVYFNPYEVAPYAYGVQPVTILFSAHPELFEASLTASPESYGAEIPLYTPFYFDLDGDAAVEEILLTTDYDYETDAYTGYTVIDGEATCHKDSYGYELLPVFIHKGDKNYLYIEELSDNDYRFTTVFELKKDGVICLGESDDHVYYARCEEGAAGRTVPTDPEDMLMERRTELLGTASGYARFTVGADGMPERKTEGYTFEREFELTVKKELPATQIDADGKPGKAVTLTVGETVFYAGTDGETYADLKRADGSTVRLRTDASDYPVRIGDDPVTELFDGILYAG